MKAERRSAWSLMLLAGVLCIRCAAETGDRASGVTEVSACNVTPSSRNLVFLGPVREASTTCADGSTVAVVTVDTVQHFCLQSETIARHHDELDIWHQSLALRVPGDLNLPAGAPVRISCFAQYVDLGDPAQTPPGACEQVACCAALHCLTADVELFAANAEAIRTP